MIPLMIDCTGKKIIIFGGGDVGVRKARFFSKEGDVVVFSRTFHPEFQNLDVDCIQADLCLDKQILGQFIEGAFLVIAATPDRVINDLIITLASARGILANNASGTMGDVTLPAKVSGKRYTIGFSTHGSSPAVARFLREKFEHDLPGLDAMISFQEILRTELKETMGDQEQREQILSDVLRRPVIWDALNDSVSCAREMVRKEMGV